MKERNSNGVEIWRNLDKTTRTRAQTKSIMGQREEKEEKYEWNTHLEFGLVFNWDKCNGLFMNNFKSMLLKDNFSHFQ